MNRKGGIFVSVVAAIFIFLFGMTFVNFIEGDIDTVGIAQNATNLDCDNLSISDGNKLTCLGTEAVSPYFIGIIVIAALGGVITHFTFGRK